MDSSSRASYGKTRTRSRARRRSSEPWLLALWDDVPLEYAANLHGSIIGGCPHACTCASPANTPSRTTPCGRQASAPGPGLDPKVFGTLAGTERDVYAFHIERAFSTAAAPGSHLSSLLTHGTCRAATSRRSVPMHGRPLADLFSGGTAAGPEPGSGTTPVNRYLGGMSMMCACWARLCGRRRLNSEWGDIKFRRGRRVPEVTANTPSWLRSIGGGACRVADSPIRTALWEARGLSSHHPQAKIQRIS